ncbi:MAG: RNA polymerase factor sigma-32 [Bdellovibrionales bacterium]|nr:RNA polymerase factor sigma-32 [Bdellovibrionales bacterium]
MVSNKKNKQLKKSGMKTKLSFPEEKDEDEDLRNAGIEILPAEIDEEEEFELESEEKSQASKDLVPFDALQAYLREIKQYPKLTREEEKALAIKYLEEGDLKSAYKLVSSNLWLVVKIARDYERAARSLLDLIQEGNIGLMEAVKNFDPYRGVRLPSYAVWWIKAYIIRYVIANWRLVKIGTTQAQRKLFFNLQKEKEKLEQEGFIPAPKLLAERLDVREQDVIDMEQRLASADLSVDAPLGTDSSANLLEVLPSEAKNAEDLMANKELQELLVDGLEEFKHTLNDKEQVIFDKRMLAEDKATLQDLSDELSISKERVRQIEEKVKLKLKEFFEDKYGAIVESFEF